MESKHFVSVFSVFSCFFWVKERKYSSHIPGLTVQSLYSEYISNKYILMDEKKIYTNISLYMTYALD